jgi:hypothetical protein
MENFTEYEKSGAVWMFAKPEWDIAETHFYSKKAYKRGEALADFVRRYDVKPGDTVIEFRAEEHIVKCIPLYSI